MQLFLIRVIYIPLILQQRGERVVEVLPLRYNPFDPITVLAVDSKDQSDYVPPSTTEVSAGVSTHVNEDNEYSSQDSVPSRRLLEHSFALQHKGPTAMQKKRLKELAQRSLRENDSSAGAVVGNSALNLSRSVFPSLLADGDTRAMTIDRLGVSHDEAKGCWWCRTLLASGCENPMQGPDIVPVNSEVVWRVPNKGNIKFKKDNDGMSCGIGCFPIFDPIKKMH